MSWRTRPESGTFPGSSLRSCGVPQHLDSEGQEALSSGCPVSTMGKADDAPPQKDHPHHGHVHVCPWWLCFTFDNVCRKLFHNPERLLKPYILPSWTVLDVGPGMGYFTIPAARLVGDTGKVIAADLQQEMLDGIYRRALKAGVGDRVELRKSEPDHIGISEAIDFCLVFWMAHEVPDRTRFFSEISASLKRDGLLLLVEPKLHVSKKGFHSTVEIAKSVGLSEIGQPRVSVSHSALLQRLSLTTPTL
jgi:SAM-dependent methyltransferase